MCKRLQLTSQPRTKGHDRRQGISCCRNDLWCRVVIRCCPLPLAEPDAPQSSQPGVAVQPTPKKKTKAQKKADATTRAASQPVRSKDNGGGNNRNSKSNNTVSGVVLDPKTLAPIQSVVDRLRNTVEKLAPAFGQSSTDNGKGNNNNRARSVSQRKREG